jgi:hypothetical protein
MGEVVDVILPLKYFIDAIECKFGEMVEVVTEEL